MSELELRKIQQPKRNSINAHLGVLGAQRYLEKPVYIRNGFWVTHTGNKINGKSSSTVYNRFELYEIWYAAKKGYRELIEMHHPDRNGGDNEAAKILNASMDWIKKHLKHRGLDV